MAFSDSFARGIASGASLGEQIRSRRRRRSEREFMEEMSGLGIPVGTADWNEQFMTRAMDRELIAPDQAASLGAAIRQQRQAEQRLAMSSFAREAIPALGADLGDERNRAMLSQIYKQHGPAVGRMWGLEPHRRVVDVDIRQTPEGGYLIAPMIENAETGTTGPMSIAGGTDDPVIGLPPEQLAATIDRRRTRGNVAHTPRGLIYDQSTGDIIHRPPGEAVTPWRGINIGGRLGVVNQATGESRISAAPPEKPKFTTTRTANGIAVTNENTGETTFESDLQADERYFAHIEDNLGDMDPQKGKILGLGVDVYRDLTSDAELRTTVEGILGGWPEDELFGAIGYLAQHDEAFPSDDQQTQRAKIIARAANLEVDEGKEFLGWLRNFGATYWNALSDPAPMVEGIVGLVQHWKRATAPEKPAARAPTPARRTPATPPVVLPPEGKLPEHLRESPRPDLTPQIMRGLGALSEMRERRLDQASAPYVDSYRQALEQGVTKAQLEAAIKRKYRNRQAQDQQLRALAQAADG